MKLHRKEFSLKLDYWNFINTSIVASKANFVPSVVIKWGKWENVFHMLDSYVNLDAALGLTCNTGSYRTFYILYNKSLQPDTSHISINLWHEICSILIVFSLIQVFGEELRNFPSQLLCLIYSTLSCDIPGQNTLLLKSYQKKTIISWIPKE